MGKSVWRAFTVGFAAMGFFHLYLICRMTYSAVVLGAFTYVDAVFGTLMTAFISTALAIGLAVNE